MYLPMILSFLSAFKHFSQSEKHILVIFFFFLMSQEGTLKTVCPSIWSKIMAKLLLAVRGAASGF